jgi:hypothetical protein
VDRVSVNELSESLAQFLAVMELPILEVAIRLLTLTESVDIFKQLWVVWRHRARYRLGGRRHETVMQLCVCRYKSLVVRPVKPVCFDLHRCLRCGSHNVTIPLGIVGRGYESFQLPIMVVHE